MTAIMKREFKAYFASPLGFVFLAIFYFFFGFFYVLSSLSMNSPDLSPVFGSMFVICLLLIPMLTMRLIADDKKQKTDQLLLTSPTGLASIVLGKFFAAYIMYLVALAISVVFALINMFATAEFPFVSFIGNLVALLALGAGLIAIGTFISSLTESTVISVIITYAVFVFILLFEALTTIIKFEWFYDYVIIPLSVNGRFSEFTSGIFSLSNIIFFISMAAIFLFLTVRSLESKRWS